MKTIRVSDMKYMGNVEIKGGFLIVKPKETYELKLVDINIMKTFLGIKFNWCDDKKFKWIKQKNNEKEIIIPQHQIDYIK